MILFAGLSMISSGTVLMTRWWRRWAM